MNPISEIMDAFAQRLATDRPAFASIEGTMGFGAIRRSIEDAAAMINMGMADIPMELGVDQLALCYARNRGALAALETLLDTLDWVQANFDQTDPPAEAGEQGDFE